MAETDIELKNQEQGEKLENGPITNKPGYLFTILFALALSIISSISTVAIYDRKYAQKVVAIDLKAYLREQKEKLAAGELSFEDLQSGLDGLEAKLNGIPKNKVVLLKEVTLRNAEEIKP